MNKLLFFGTILMVSASAFGNYNSMEFKYTDGTAKTLKSDGLTIIVDGSSLQISNSAGETFTVEAAALASMQFVDDSGAVKSLEVFNGNVEAYSLDGLYYGKFESVEQAHQNLENGVYILKGSEGKSIKIVVNR